MSINSKTWLKNDKNGIIYEVNTDEVKIFKQEGVAEASPQDVKNWGEGTYWNLRESEKTNSLKAQVIPSVAEPDPNEGVNKVNPEELKPTGDGLDRKTKAELLKILEELDPQNTLDDKTLNADIIESIRVFQAATKPE